MDQYVADFETTTDENDVRVWAYGISKIGSDDSFRWGKTIDEFMEWTNNSGNPIVYFHNLSFDGEFIIYWLLTHGYTHSDVKADKTFSVIISDQGGVFYQIEVIHKRMNKKYDKVTFRDSLKKLPFTVKKIAKDFKLEIMKGEIDYNKERPEGYDPDENELAYLKNDCEIVSKALHIQFQQNLTKMTIGSDAMSSFKEMIGKVEFKRNFPKFPYNLDQQLRQAYKGGFTYLKDDFKGIDVGDGLVFDVNSLYPSVMYDCLMPFGIPRFYKGEYKHDELYPLYIQQLTCTFRIKPDHIPTIQLKNNLRFKSTEYLKESGSEEVLLTLTSVDLKLFFDHYDVQDITWICGWKFGGSTGIFKEYIDYWMEIKENSTGAIRLLAKLMLNNLYGKFGTNPDMTGKYPVLHDGHVKYLTKETEIKDPVYIPIAAFTTAYAREKTIRSAQALYHRFIYADTDSLHLIGTEIPENLQIHPTKLGWWDHESTFTKARFIKPKTYVEYVDDKLKVTCAGMPDTVKNKVTYESFHVGFTSYGKLIPKHVAGGIMLKDTEFTIR